MKVLISPPCGDKTRLVFGTGASLPRAVVLSAILALLTACQPVEELQPIAEPVRPVRFVTVNERNAIDAVRANLAAAMARLVETRNTVERYEPLLPRGFVARALFDRAVEARDAAQAQVEEAESQLGFTTLIADGPGIVNARGAEPSRWSRPGAWSCSSPARADAMSA